MRAVLQDVFGQGISNSRLQASFATPGRKADDRVDQEQLNLWLEGCRPLLEREAAALTAAIEREWPELTQEAARQAGKARLASAKKPGRAGRRGGNPP